MGGDRSAARGGRPRARRVHPRRAAPRRARHRARAAAPHRRRAAVHAAVQRRLGYRGPRRTGRRGDRDRSAANRAAVPGRRTMAHRSRPPQVAAADPRRGGRLAGHGTAAGLRERQGTPVPARAPGGPGEHLDDRRAAAGAGHVRPAPGQPRGLRRPIPAASAVRRHTADAPDRPELLPAGGGDGRNSGRGRGDRRAVRGR